VKIVLRAAVALQVLSLAACAALLFGAVSRQAASPGKVIATEVEIVDDAGRRVIRLSGKGGASTIELYSPGQEGEIRPFAYLQATTGQRGKGVVLRLDSGEDSITLVVGKPLYEEGPSIIFTEGGIEVQRLPKPRDAGR
jgi:hypothetical protein